MNSKIKVAIADDHVLLRNALCALINSFEEYEVVVQASNGEELIQRIKLLKLEPDIILLDLNMPVLDGYKTAAVLKERCPAIKVLMLTMYDSELAMIRLLQSGVRGFLKKDIEPSELKFALTSLMQSGFYYSTTAASRLANIIRNSSGKDNPRYQNSFLDDQQLQFLKLACTEMTYKQIAENMRLSPRSVDGIRDQLFNKLDVKSRVGLALIALKTGLVSLAD